MLGTLLLVGTISIFGIAVIVSLGVHAEKITQILLGIVFGVTVATSLTYLGTAIFSLGISLGIVSLLAVIGITFLSLRMPWWERLRHAPVDWIGLVFFLCLGGVFALIAPKLLFTSPEGLSFGIVNAYGDVAWHVATITAFEQGQSFIPDNPIFAHHRLNYPFLANFFSAMLLKTGMSLPRTVSLPAVVFIPILLTLFYAFVRDTSRQRAVAIVTVLLFLGGGGMWGFTRLVDDWQESGTSLLTFITHLPVPDYSGGSADPDGYFFSNLVTTLVLPQRPFLFGFSIAASILLLVSTQRRQNYVIAGILAGLLPFFHAHSVLALIPVIIIFFWLRPSWYWLYFIVPAGVLGFPEVLYYLTVKSEPGSFLRFSPGWTAPSAFPLLFWLRNTGLLLPITVLGFFLPAPRTVKVMAAVGLLLFVAANLFSFAPWEWDTIKVLIYWFMFTLPLFAWVLVRLVYKKHILYSSVAVLLIALHLISGSLDIWKLALPSAPTWVEWSTAAQTIATDIMKTTPPGTIIATAPIHNSPIFLAGRFAYLGFGAHVWSHGLNPAPREKALDDFYRGNRTHLPTDFPSFVLVGPDEQAKYGSITIDPAWLVITTTDTHVLYKIRP